MKTLFISSIVEGKFFESLINSSPKNKPSIAGQRFERLIAEGLNAVGEIQLLSYLPIAKYPQSNRIITKLVNTKFLGMNLTYIPMLNIALLKQLCIMFFTLVYTLGWCLKNKGKEKKILLNVVYIPTALPSLLVGKIFNVPVVVVVPDVSSFRFEYTKTKGFFKKIITHFIKKTSERIDQQFDGYVFLTEMMNNLMNKKNKPYIVVEGMIPLDERPKEGFKKNKSPNYIMYAGTLRKRYGISNLIEAFHKIKRKDIELWIFGSGDQEEEIKRISLNNSRVKFFGLKPQVEVFAYEKEALLLINPRPTSEEFTKYSFPSKTLEYMSSGTPLLTTNLPGIPKEYIDYLFIFEKETIDGFRDKIDSVLEMDGNELYQFGQSAKDFVNSKKNHLVQTKKIYNFLKMVKKI